MKNRSSSTRVAQYSLSALAGALSAVVLAVALLNAGSVLVLLSYLASIPLFMVGLGLGLSFNSVAVVVGLFVLLSFWPPSFGAFYVISYAGPALVLSALALRQKRNADGQRAWHSEGNLLTALASYPCVLFLAIYITTAGHDGGLLAMTVDAFNGMSEQIITMLKDNGQEVSPEMILKMHQYFEICARVTPALAMCAWLFSTLLAIAIAQGLLQSRLWNKRPSFELNDLHVPNWVVFAAATTGLIGMYAPAPYDYVGLNLALILGIPFFFVGVAVIHAAAAQTKHPTVMLIIFYTLISIIIHLVLLVALLGAVDQWVDFRKRLTEKTST